MKGYDTAAYAATRLNETVIRHKDDPVMVVQCTPGKRQSDILVYHRKLIDDDGSMISAPIDEYNLDPVPLGYVNHGANATYLTRMPMRKDWRQGARMINIVDPNGYNPSRIGMHQIAVTIKGVFPTIRETLNELNKRLSRPTRLRAFSRDFAISEDSKLMYKGLFEVGTVNMENGGLLVHDNFGWVREALEESMENAA